MNAQTKERKNKETLVININLTWRGVTLLAGALLIIALLGSLTWRQQKVHARSETLAPSSAPLASTSTGYISVPASAFRPNSDSLDYTNRGYDLKVNTGFGSFTAPLRLPHGATVISMTVHFDNQDLGDSGFARMSRTEFGGFTPMAEILFVGDSGSLSDTSIDYAVIDNAQYSYYLSVYFNDPTITLYEVLIEYTYPVYLPVILGEQ